MFILHYKIQCFFLFWHRKQQQKLGWEGLMATAAKTIFFAQPALIEEPPLAKILEEPQRCFSSDEIQPLGTRLNKSAIDISHIKLDSSRFAGKKSESESELCWLDVKKKRPNGNRRKV